MIVTKIPLNYIPSAETIVEFNYLYNLGYKVINFLQLLYMIDVKNLNLLKQFIQIYTLYYQEG